MPNDDEPEARGRLDRRAVEAKARRDVLVGVALFTGIVMISSILAILFIALMQAAGLWTTYADEAMSLPAAEAEELRLAIHALVRPQRPSPLGPDSVAVKGENAIGAGVSLKAAGRCRSGLSHLDGAAASQAWFR